MTEGKLIETLEVIQASTDNSELLWGCNIDMPNKGEKTDSYEIVFKGWVLGKKYRAVAVELIASGSTIEKIPVEQSRPDVFEVYPDIFHAKKSGFLAKVEAGKLPEAGVLTLEAVFSHGSRVCIGEVQYRKQLPFLQQVQVDLERSQTRLQEIEAELEIYAHRLKQPSQPSDRSPLTDIVHRGVNNSRI
jgi:hypothetical protein